jgi:hypothetical protein
VNRRPTKQFKNDFAKKHSETIQFETSRGIKEKEWKWASCSLYSIVNSTLSGLPVTPRKVSSQNNG